MADETAHRPNGCCDYHRHIADGCCHCELQAEKAHTLTMEVQDEPRMFRATCSCGWAGAWATTNACMGRGKSHVAAMRRRLTSLDRGDRS